MVDLALLLKSDLFWLFISSFYQAYANSLSNELLNIFFAAMHTRLDYCTHVFILLMHTQCDIYCLFCVRRSFHIDTHENWKLLRVFQNTTDVLFA